jgi:hypothetical protein
MAGPREFIKRFVSVANWRARVSAQTMTVARDVSGAKQVARSESEILVRPLPRMTTGSRHGSQASMAPAATAAMPAAAAVPATTVA